MFFVGWCRSQRSRNDEVDFAFRKTQFYKIRVLSVVGRESFCRGADARGEIPEELGIVYEDIYVITQAMAMPAHQDRAATEGPLVHWDLMPTRVLDQLKGVAKQNLPRS